MNDGKNNVKTQLNLQSESSFLVEIPREQFNSKQKSQGYVEKYIIPFGQIPMMPSLIVIAGQATFQIHKSTKQEQTILKTKIYRCIRLFQQTQWTFTWSNMENLLFLFGHMINSNCKFLDVSGQKMHTIPEQILAPRFQSLLNLDLRKNNLVSIQNLAFIDAVDLKYINLADNILSQVRCLNKTQFPQLNQLILYNNQLIEVNVHRMNVKSQKIGFIFGPYEKQRNFFSMNRTVYDFSFYLKLEVNNFSDEMKKEISFLNKKSKFKAHKKCYKVIMKRIKQKKSRKSQIIIN